MRRPSILPLAGARWIAASSLVLLAGACGPVRGPIGAPGSAGASARLPDGDAHHFREIELTSSKSGPSILTVGGDQSVWVALARASRIGRIMADGERREYDLGTGSFPVGLTIGPDGAAWFSDIKRNKIVRLDAAGGEQREFAIQTHDAWPFTLVRTPAGIFYFTERVGNRIGRLDPATGEIREVPVPTQGAQPAGIALTPDGQIFFTENSANRIGHLDPVTEAIEEIPVPTPATPGPFYGPAGIASDGEGNVWFAQLDGRLGLIRRGDRTRIEEFALPNPKVRPGGVAVDVWGYVWYTGLDGNCIGSFDPATGRFREYPLPSGRADPRPMSPPEATARGEVPRAAARAQSTRPFGIAIDARGRVWFSEQYGHRVGYLQPPSLEIVSPSGVVGGPAVPIQTRTRALPEGVRLRYEVDDAPVESADTIDASALSPGPHRWRVVAEVDGRGIAQAVAEIHVNPTMAGLERLAARIAQRGELDSDAAALVSRQVAAARQAAAELRGDAVRKALQPVLARIASADGAPGERPGVDLLAQHLRQYELFAERHYQLSVHSDCAGLGEASVEVGDVITWRNAGSSQELRLVALDGSFRSPQISPGREWSHRFGREGRAEYGCGDGSGKGVVTVAPRSATLREFPMPGPDRVPTVLTVSPDGTVWATAGGGGYANLARVPLNDRIARLGPDRNVVEFRTPTSESAPTSIKRARDGTLWFTERAGNKIGRVEPNAGRITEYPVPTPQAGLTGIAIDGDDNVWFTEKKASQIGRLDTRTGSIREIPTPHPNAEPSTVVVDGEGKIWFDERGADNLVRLDPTTDAIQLFRVPTRGSRVIGLVPDPRGYVWFLELAGNKIGRLEVATGQVREIAIPTPMATPFKAWLDRHGRLWFTEAFGNKIGVLQGETFFEFALPRQGSMPGGIEIDAQDNVWFTEQVGNAIGVIPRAAALLAPGPAEDAPVPQPPRLAAELRSER